jgi:hypothetical protein
MLIYSSSLGKWGGFKRKDHFGDADTDRRTILRQTLRKQNIWIKTGFNWLRIRSSGSPL